MTEFDPQRILPPEISYSIQTEAPDPSSALRSTLPAVLPAALISSIVSVVVSVFAALLFFFPVSCSKAADTGTAPRTDEYLAERDTEEVFDDFLGRILQNAEIPDPIARQIKEAAANGPSFIMDLLTCISGDPQLYALVDKAHALPTGYAPDDLVQLAGTAGGDSYEISRHGLMLRESAAIALEEMAAAARADGITLIAGSTYRSYDYQVGVYNRNVEESGQETADRESARPGYSQHQTGLVVDFAPIDDTFAATPAGAWALRNASAFGWSLSFPDGYEPVTGYRWESWHYRYVGRDLAAFIDTYFNGIQQYALRFIYEWHQE
ncbi:D-alanyl-D-alanine carboxypeptidase [Spirochaetia bacterium]|nr:D-alanyl-D-alanine carboxypeptidase [Spirochaetia bacterium]